MSITKQGERTSQIVSGRLELEEAIMSAWNMCEDIETIYGNTDGASEDEIANSLMGLKQIAHWKFEKLFKVFEDCIKKGEV